MKIVLGINDSELDMERVDYENQANLSYNCSHTRKCLIDAKYNSNSCKGTISLHQPVLIAKQSGVDMLNMYGPIHIGRHQSHHENFRWKEL